MEGGRKGEKGRWKEEGEREREIESTCTGLKTTLCQTTCTCIFVGLTRLGVVYGSWGTKMTGRRRRFLGMGTDSDRKGSKVTDS